MVSGVPMRVPKIYEFKPCALCIFAFYEGSIRLIAQGFGMEVCGVPISGFPPVFGAM